MIENKKKLGRSEKEQISIGEDLNQNEITEKILKVIFDEIFIKEIIDDALAKEFILAETSSALETDKVPPIPEW